MAGKVAQAVAALAARGEFPADDLTTKVVGKHCYFNWVPASDRFERQAAGLSKFLRDQGCRDVQFQLESGRGITVAPGLALE